MFKKVGVVGAGTMGVGVTVDFLLHNIKTVLVDISQEKLDQSKEAIIKELRFVPLISKKKHTIREEDVIKNVQFTTDLNEVSSCEFIVENVTEDLAIKKALYKKLDTICPPDVCFGVNTSCTSITQIGSVVSRPDKIVGVHFMNPVYMKPTVEVIRGFHTSEYALSQLNILLSQMEKDSIVVNDLPGFVSNRVSHLFMNEAAFVVQDQVASPEQVDAIFKKCYGHTMGPLETADLIGLDTVMHSIDVLYESYQDSKFRCCPLLRKMVQSGNLGRKTGKGFYDYSYQ